MQADPHILIIDDDPEMRSLLQELFEASKYRVSSRESAHAAYTDLQPGGSLAGGREGVEDDGLDLIISDVHMPGMSGMEF